MILSPCKGCPDRYPACSDYCDKYKEFRRKLDDMKARVAAEKAAEHGCYRIAAGFTRGIERERKRKKYNVKADD